MTESESMEYISEKDIEIINRILERGNDVVIKRNRDVVKICEESVNVARKKYLSRE